MSDDRWPLDDIYALLERRGIGKERVLLLAETGSTAHGINVSGQDDLDLIVVWAESYRQLVNKSATESQMIRTQPEGTRSGPGDIDLQVYTLGKFTRLVSGGNPSILNALFTSYRLIGGPAVEWADMPKFVCGAKAAYLGYAEQQRDRWTGARGQKNVNRPELVEKYGYDTKYAAHAIRLALQGYEFLTTGKVTLPMVGYDRDVVVGVRTGTYRESDALDILNASIGALKELPDVKGELCGEWLAQQYAWIHRHEVEGLAFATT